MAPKRAFISFDFDHDDDLRTMLAGQAKNPDTPFEIKDRSIREPLTGDWKDKVRGRMDNVDLVVVLCGEFTHLAT
jgi:antiphage defense system Thoeris ThsB-like protein